MTYSGRYSTAFILLLLFRCILCQSKTVQPVVRLSPSEQINIYSRIGRSTELCVFVDLNSRVVSSFRQRTSRADDVFYARYPTEDGPLMSLLYSVDVISPFMSRPEGNVCVYFHAWHPPLLYPDYDVYPLILKS
jgi:hypothetical protein